MRENKEKSKSLEVVGWQWFKCGLMGNSLVVQWLKTRCLHCRGPGVQFLVRGLSSPQPKNKKRKKEKFLKIIIFIIIINNSNLRRYYWERDIWHLIIHLANIRSALPLSHIQLFVTSWTVACQAPLSMGFFKQEYWSGVPFSCFRGSSQSTCRTCVSCIAGRFFTYWAIREAHYKKRSLEYVHAHWHKHTHSHTHTHTHTHTVGRGEREIKFYHQKV